MSFFTGTIITNSLLNKLIHCVDLSALNTLKFVVLGLVAKVNWQERVLSTLTEQSTCAVSSVCLNSLGYSRWFANFLQSLFRN